MLQASRGLPEFVPSLIVKASLLHLQAVKTMAFAPSAPLLPGPGSSVFVGDTAAQCPVRPPRQRSAISRRLVMKRSASSQKKESSPAPPSPSSTLEDLKTGLKKALDGLNRGLNIDVDSPTMGQQEAQVEDLIERIEDLNDTEVPTKDPRMFGTWELLYTSSSITRFFGGATGLQRLLPEGQVGRVEQYIDPENGTSEVREELSFEIPVIGTPMKNVAVASGKIRATAEDRQAWDPEYVQFYFFKQFADGWKTLRAFQIMDTTFLDDTLRITRGQTGSVAVFEKVD